MSAQRQRARVLRIERLHQFRPQQPRRTQLGDLHEVVHADRPEEREARREAIDGESRGKAGAHVLDAVGEGVGKLEVLRRTRLLHMIAGDRDRIEFRHPLRGEGEDVGDDPQRWRRRINVRVADHELLEDVVLDRAGELFRRHALFLGGDDVERKHRQHGAVHGHRYRHAIERDTREQCAHVVDRIDRDARHADVAADARMVAVVAAMRGEIEGDRKALLAGREIAAVEGVRNPPQSKSRRIGAPSTAASHTSWGRARADRAGSRDRCRENRAPQRQPGRRPASPECLQASSTAAPSRRRWPARRQIRPS